jgi:hypothetical protein
MQLRLQRSSLIDQVCAALREGLRAGAGFGLRFVVSEDNGPAPGGRGDPHVRPPQLDRLPTEALEFIHENRAYFQPARIAEWKPAPDPWRLEGGAERIPERAEVRQ